MPFDLSYRDASIFFTAFIPVFAAIFIDKILLRAVHVPKNLESPRARTYMSVAKSTLRTIVYITALYYVFVILNVNVTPLFASAGVVGIILGLGVRSFIEDFFTGVLILTQDTISVGDYVEIGGSEGITEAIGLRTVRLRDQNGALHIFPNREIKKIINYSRRQARVVVDIPVKSNQSIDTVFLVFSRALDKLRKHKELGPHIHQGSMVQGIESITGDSLVIRSLILTRASLRWTAAREYKYVVLRELAKAKILLG